MTLVRMVVAVAWFAGLASAADKSITASVVNPLEKLRPDTAAPEKPIKSAELYAARNEFEPFQIALRSERGDAAGIDADAGDLRNGSGGKISKQNITIYFEKFVNITKPSLEGGATGLWPDPLVPRVDRYANEKRNAFPFTLRQGQTQPLWIEVFVPETTRPGAYSGSVDITAQGKLIETIPIHLHVWAFTLPATSTLKTSFGLNGGTVLKEHRGRYTDDEDLYDLTRLYQEAALMHRISTNGGTMIPPKYVPGGAVARLDWHTYDHEVGPFLDGTVIPPDAPLHGAQATSVDLRTPGTFGSPDQQLAYWRAWVKHFREKGWSDRLFLYLWDEPAIADYQKVIDRGRAAIEADSSIRSLVTVPLNKRLDGVVKIWAPLVNCLEQKPGFDNFCMEAPPLDAYASEIKDGKSLWFYQSCASHGCNAPGGTYFQGWPSYMIDECGAGNRVMPWVAWKYRIEGELYYSMNEAYGRGKDPWDSVLLFGGNGDGTLFYPGRPDRIGGHSDIPIESIRLKLIREGMEDYEYLALLAKLAGPKRADEFAERIVAKPYLWDSDPNRFLAVRQAMGETLNRLASERSEARGDAQ